jgi:WD40 repeat protein
MNLCPPRAQLERLLAECLSEAECEMLEEHLVGCVRCQETLEELSNNRGVDAAPLAVVANVPTIGGMTRGFLEELKARVGLAPEPPGGSGLPSVPGYEIVGELGRGGMGVVYKARHLRLDRLVALKMILSGVYAGPHELARFRTEAEVIARIQHPNIVQIFDVGEAPLAGGDGCPFLSLELVEGGSLARKLTGRPLPAREAAGLVQSLARAIHAAHQLGIIHRDLKPGNILLTADGTPKITDFGLAKRVDAETTGTQSGVLMGTPEYMAPEQAAGKSKEIGPATDVYALGVILYELLTGRPPFKGQTSLDTLQQVLSDEPVPPSRLQPKVPRDLETICLKSLQKEPARRYTSAAALADDLERFQAGRPILARPVGTLERTLRWCRRNPAATGLVAALLIGASVSLYFAIQAEIRAGAYLKQKNRANTTADELRASVDREKETAKREREKAEQLRGLLYVARMSALRQSWEEGNLTRIRSALDQHLSQPGEKDLRQWEWHYQYRLCHGELRTLRGPKIGVLCAAFSQDGRWLAAGTSGNSLSPATVEIWDLANGREVYKLAGHDGPVLSVAFTPDGRRLISASQLGVTNGGGSHGTIKVWNLASGEELNSWRTPSFDDRIGVVLSPDRTQLVLPCHGQLRVWDPRSGQELRGIDAPQGHPPNWSALAYSPDGRWLASMSGSMQGKSTGIQLWDAASGRSVRTIGGKASCLAFSPEGRRLLAGSDDNGGHGELKLWDVPTGQELCTFPGQTSAVLNVAFSPDGWRVASIANEGGAKVWDAHTGQLLRTVWHTDRNTDHQIDTGVVAFSPDGQRLATACGYEFRPGDVKVWDVGSGPESRTFSAHGNPTSVAFTSGAPGLTALSGAKKWNLKCGGLDLQAFELPNGARTVSFDQGKLAAIVGDEVKVWNGADGRELAAFKALQGAGRVVCLAFSPDGQRLAVGGGPVDLRVQDYGYVGVFQAATGKRLLTVKGHTREIISYLAFSPDGRLLFSGSRDGTTIAWDADSGKERYSAKGTGLMAFTPDSQRLAMGGKPAKIYDVGTGQELCKLPDGGAPAFSPDGQRLAIVSGGILTLYDGRPWTLQSAEEYEALGLVDFLFDELAFKADVAKAIRAHKGISKSVRARALVLADRYQEDDAERLNAAAWRIVRQPGASAEKYQRALRQVQRACELDPKLSLYKITLGVAQYRLGRYEDAAATLGKENTGTPANQAFLAMAQHQLGQKDKAKATLDQARKGFSGERLYYERAILFETEELIQPKPSAPR